MISIYINLSVKNIIKEYKMSEMHNKNAENTISIRFFLYDWYWIYYQETNYPIFVKNTVLRCRYQSLQSKFVEF